MAENQADNNLEPNKSLICGHRGASGHAPENTLAAFREAQEAGADWLEFDVQLSADDEIIILHDDTLKRTTNLGQDLPPSRYSLSELKKLDAGGWFGPGFAGEPIPTLDEVLEEFGGKMGLNIELKSKPGAEADNGLEAKVAEKLARHNLFEIEKVIVSSFDAFRLMALHKLNEQIPIGLLYHSRQYPRNFDIFQLIPLTGARAIHPNFQLIDQNLMKRARQQNLMVNTWTVNQEADMRKMLELGVDIIITNYPAQLRELR